jgi:hypothetical protein
MRGWSLTGVRTRGEPELLADQASQLLAQPLEAASVVLASSRGNVLQA